MIDRPPNLYFFFICVSTNFEFSQPLSREIREVNSTQINPIQKEEEEKLGKVSQTGSRITLNKFSSGWIDSGNFAKLVWNLALPPVAMHHHALSFKQKKKGETSFQVNTHWVLVLPVGIVLSNNTLFSSGDCSPPWSTAHRWNDIIYTTWAKSQCIREWSITAVWMKERNRCGRLVTSLSCGVFFFFLW